jgi:hypothetical protein
MISALETLGSESGVCADVSPSMNAAPASSASTTATHFEEEERGIIEQFRLRRAGSDRMIEPHDGTAQERDAPV